MKKILICLTLILSLGLAGCSDNKLTNQEILQVSKENKNIKNISELINDLDNNIYKFINFDIKENDYYITELELENMQYEITKARDTYDNINFDLLERYCKSLEKEEESKIDYDLSHIQIMKSEFKQIIDSYEKMVQLGKDMSYSNKDYDIIKNYDYDVIKAIHKINLFNKGFNEFFRFYGLFAYDINQLTLSDIENTIKSSGYKYEYEKSDGKSASSKTLKSLIVYDNNSDDSITFQGYSDDAQEFDLILVQYNIGKTGSTVDMSSHSFLGLSDNIKYGGFNFKTKEKPEFKSIDDQYEYVQNITDSI